MRIFSVRTTIALVASVALSLLLLIYVSKSPYIFGLALVLGAYLARLSSFKAGLVFGTIAAVPLGVYLALNGLAPADSDEFSVILNAILLILLGGIYCGVVTWLIQSLKRGKGFFS